YYFHFTVIILLFKPDRTFIFPSFRNSVSTSIASGLRISNSSITAIIVVPIVLVLTLFSMNFRTSFLIVFILLVLEWQVVIFLFPFLRLAARFGLVCFRLHLAS